MAGVVTESKGPAQYEPMTEDELPPLWTQAELDSNNGKWCSRCWKQCAPGNLKYCLPCNCLLWPCRKAVSKNKDRYEKDGFSLDLTYLHPRVIILGFPAAGLEHLIRNPRLEVKRFLDTKHRNNYKLFNFCVEPGRYYEPEIFEGRVRRFPYRDHNVPHLQVLSRFLRVAEQWLAEDDKHVVALHCKAGKGRAGMMSCALLVHLGYQPTAVAAIAHYDRLRVWENHKALTVPSQIRYVSYAERLSKTEKRSGFEHEDIAGVITGIALGNNNARAMKVLIEVQQNCVGNKKVVWKSTGASQSFQLKANVTGNVLLTILTAGGKVAGRLWFNISLLDGEHFIFKKNEIDKMEKDKKHKKYPADFYVKVDADISGAMNSNPMRQRPSAAQQLVHLNMNKPALPNQRKPNTELKRVIVARESVMEEVLL